MADNDKTQEQQQEVTLEAGTYEIIRNRLVNHGRELSGRLDRLNQARKEVFGAIETRLLSTSRITTENNCMPRDIIPVGNLFIFGYNVHIGLRSEVQLSDVFAVYSYENHEFHAQPLDLIRNEQFAGDFKNLYRYYKNTCFAKFSVIGPYLYMVFQVGKNIADVKVFKWLIEADRLTYVDSRSEHEFKFPLQQEVVWIKTRRELHRGGQFPHISIEDRIFVETTGGDLTVKIEDNTDSGEGIYREPVENPDQTLDDAEIFYAKVQQARRIDSIKDSCVLLPDSHGLIFAKGYYLQTGDFKEFDHNLQNMLFDTRMHSLNGEDYLYVFYNRELGVYVLLSYNLIEQKVNIPVICNGYAFFSNGELVYFKAEKEPTKHHVVQIWQTPYTGINFVPPVNQDSYLYKIGNKDIVRAMAECSEICNLTQRQDTFANLYVDIVKKAGDCIDSYFWLGEETAFNLLETLSNVRDTASGALDEFEKVVRIKKGTAEQVEQVRKKTAGALTKTRRGVYSEIDQYVQALAELRTVRGQIITLKDLRYVDKALVEALEAEIGAETDKFSKACVEFLLQPEALKVYENKVSQNESRISEIKTGTDAKALEENTDSVASELDLMIEIVSSLKIDDPVKTTQIIDSISDIYTRLNQSRASLKKRKKELLSVEAVAEFNSQIKLLNQGVINYLDVCDTPEKTDQYLTKLMVQIEELEGRFVDFDEFIVQLTDKREEVYSAFEVKKLSLLEARNKRATALQSAAERILKAVQSRVAQFTTVDEINGYFASDLMVDKVRGIVTELLSLNDTVRADDIQTRLKTAKEDAVRQLKDRQELFVAGENVIKLGSHQFTVTKQVLDATVVQKDRSMYFHLTGTNFFEKITDQEFLTTQQVWEQDLVSENREVYRSEFLTWQLLKASEAGNVPSVDQIHAMTDAECVEAVQRFMGPRYEEGYVKGVHDHDAARLLKAIAMMKGQIGMLCYSPAVRACASLFWHAFVDEPAKAKFTARISGIGDLISLFPKNRQWTRYVNDLCEVMTGFIA
ncbi:MAG TPA: DNA repair ATPase, partial [Thermodesulfovibrionia bacterium]|nr:DNA repair ATPase [Thermodesulfovibrionia bacterium]